MFNHMNKLLHITLSIIATIVSFGTFAQISPSGQSKLIAPATLSACSRDTVRLEFTNKEGPSCTGVPGSTPNSTFTVTIPTGNTDIAYETGSISSMPTGATATIIGGQLVISAPTPAFGLTTTVKFVLNTQCSAVPSDTLPYMSVAASYPASFTTTSESFVGSKMNTGIAQLNYSLGPQVITQGFASDYTTYVAVSNSGYGSTDQIKMTYSISDSMYRQYTAYHDEYLYIDGPGLPAAISVVWNTLPGYTHVDNPDGSHTFSAILKANQLDQRDGKFDNGDLLYVRPGYDKFPNTCGPNQWASVVFEPICASGGSACTKNDTSRWEFRITAGTPVIAATSVTTDTWDGCPDKNASFTFVNNGVPSATQPEVSTAYDIEFSVPMKGKMDIKNVLIGGVSGIATQETFPGIATGITWKIKDFNTTPIPGLVDLDGDGFIDDMIPGASVTVSWQWAVPCNGACGPDLMYDITANSKFTDYCRKLDGSGSTPIYKFGLAQTAPISQVTPVPDFGFMTPLELKTRTGSFTFNYTQTNVNLANAVVKLRINYSKNMQVVEPISFLGTSRMLSDFTIIGSGYTPPAGFIGSTTVYTPDTTNNTTDVDSALEYTLTAAEVATLFDNTGDNLTYSIMHITCSNFQNQTNSNNFQILFQFGTAPCAANNLPPCALDMACKKGLDFQINEGCGTIPCYINYDTLYRTSIIGSTDVSQNTSAAPLSTASNSEFYPGDSLTYLSRSYLSNDWPIMEPIGNTVSGSDFIKRWSVSYHHKPGTPYDLYPLEFLPIVSRVFVVDTVTGDTIAKAPIRLKHFSSLSGVPSATQDLATNNYNVYDNAATGYVPGGSLAAYYCATGSDQILDLAHCPYRTERFRTTTPTVAYAFWVSANEEWINETYDLRLGEVLSDAGYTFDPGYRKYRIYTDIKYKVTENYPHDNLGDITFGSDIWRYGNKNYSAPSGTYMGSCGLASAVGTISTKNLSIQDPGATYNSDCGLTICNKLYLKSISGDVFPGGEVRVPYKLDSIVVDIPSEYQITAGNTYQYHQGGSIQTGTATNSASTGHVVWTSTGINGEFPRMDDMSGNNLVHSLCYPISAIGAGNGNIDNYRVPVVYWLRNEWGVPFKLVDTVNITEGLGDVTVSPLGGVVRVSDALGCGKPYMDVLLANNTLYTAGSVLINVEGTASSNVVAIEDVGMPVDPITSEDTGTVFANRKYALLGAFAPAEQRIVRVYFNSTLCEDSIKVVSNFGCAYPAGNNIYANPGSAPNFTLDSAYIKFTAVEPKMMLGAITPKVNIGTACDTATVIVEITNVKDPNLFNILAGFKLPPNAKYVAGTMKTNNTQYIDYLPYDMPILGASLTSFAAAGDSMVLDLSAEINRPHFLGGYNAYYMFPGCGLPGPGDNSTLNSVIGYPLTLPSALNRVRVTFQVEFTACPTSTSDVITFDARANNNCGQITTGKAAVNILYQGVTGSPNAYTCESNNSKPLYICAGVGETQPVIDSVKITITEGTNTTGLDSVLVTVAGGTSISLSNFGGGTLGAPVVGTTPEGRTTLKYAVPAGLPLGSVFYVPISYDILVLDKDFCTPNPAIPCADISKSVEVFSTININCPSKGIVCAGLGQIKRGTGYAPRDLACCAGLGDKVWADSNFDGLQSINEPGVPAVKVDLYKNGPDGLPGTADDIFVGTQNTGANGEYYFEDLIPSTDSATEYSVRFSNPPVGTGFTKNVGAGDNQAPTNSDGVGTNAAGIAGTSNQPSYFARTGSINLMANEQDSTIDAGVTPLASLGNRVWDDLNANGIQDAGEPGIAGVAVQLYDSVGAAVIDPVTGLGVSTFTDANGYYLFDSLQPSKYNVFIRNAVNGNTPLTDYVKTTSTLPGDNENNTNSDGYYSDGYWAAGTPSLNYILSAGESDTTVDFGFYKPASIGNQVWVDADGDGLLNNGELGLGGVTVYLYNDLGVIIDSAITDPSGNYLIDSLKPATYTIGFKYPAGYAPTQQTGTTDDNVNNNSDASITPDASGVFKTAPVVLTSGENNLTVDAGVVAAASLGNQVWVDTDGDGLLNNGELGLAGVDVYLLDAGAVVIDSTVTDATGNYLFPDLTPGTYSVGFDYGLGYNPTLQTGTTDDNIDNNSDAAVTPNANGLFLTAPVVLVSGENNLTVDAGVTPTPKASIGNTVFLDTDKNGTQGASDPGIAGVTVTLYNDAGIPVATTITDGLGKYKFTDLTPGDYSVGFTPPADYKFTSPSALADDQTDLNSDASTIPGATFGKSGLITLSPNEFDSTVDAGLIPSTTQNVGNKVWFDTDKDGIQGPTEEGVAGVTVTLKDASGNVVATTITNSVGDYLFKDVPAGAGYTIAFTPPVGTVFTTQEATSNTDNTGSNPNALGVTPAFTVTAGQDNLTIDAGIYLQDVVKASVGNKVWEDLNNDGIQDAGEPGISGVIVTLKDDAGVTVATATTNEFGEYIFNDLTPGTYTIDFATPAGYAASPYTAGISNPDNSDNNAGSTAPFTLAPGEKNLNVDAGFNKTAPAGIFKLGDKVWYDNNKDGLQDISEPGVAGVTVKLLDASGAVIATTATDANGNYLFPNLALGTYQVQFDNLPDGYVLTNADASGTIGNANAGAGGTNDSDPGASGLTPPINLTADNLDVDAGIIPGKSDKTLASLGNKVWYDTDNDGVQDANEVGVAGVTVTLKDAQGAVLGTTTTDALGNYIFTGLEAGNYVVEFSNLPVGYAASPNSGDVNNPTNSDGVETAPASGIFATAPVSLGAGDNNSNVDFGIFSPLNAIGDKVYYDANNDGIQDAGETGAPGVIVTLYNAAGAAIKTTTTDANGNYMFTGLTDGNYSLGFSNLPSGFGFSPSITPGDNGNNTNSDANTVTGRTAVFALSGNEVDSSVDAGIYNPNVGSVGGQIWADANADGIQDLAEAPTPGLLVTLKDGFGNIIGTAVTDGNGEYLFTNLPLGDYTVEFNKPDGTVYSPNAPIGTPDNTSNNGVTGSMPVSLTMAQPNSRNNDAAYNTPQLASIGDYVWADVNADGIQDPTEAPLAGIKVTLFDAAGNTVGTAITDENGKYQINDIPPGSGYYVNFSNLPAGSTLSPKDASTATDALDSDADPITGNTPAFSLLAGEHNPTLDAGVIPQSYLGSLVWNDVDNDGVFDAGEQPVPGAVVTVYGSNGTTVIGTATTDANGQWKVPVTGGESYYVGIDTSTTQSLHVSDVTDPAGNDESDNDVDRSTGKTLIPVLVPLGTYVNTTWIGVTGLAPLNIGIVLSGKANLTENTLTWTAGSNSILNYSLIKKVGGMLEVIHTTKSTGAVTYMYKDTKLDTFAEYYVDAEMANGLKINSNSISIVRDISENVVTFSPNPTINYTNVSFISSITGFAKIQVVDANGKLVRIISVETAKGSNTVIVNLETLASGTYMVKVQLPDGIAVAKPIVKN
jgi:protocatechuate 3,4-dioxygenase beta subunit